MVKCCGRSDLLLLAEWAHAFPTTRAGTAAPMTAEKNRHVPLSTEVSPREAEVDPQLSACAQEAHPLRGFPGRSPAALAERFTFHDLLGQVGQRRRAGVGTERLTHDDPRTTQKVYRRKPRRARLGAKILDASGDIGP